MSGSWTEADQRPARSRFWPETARIGSGKEIAILSCSSARAGHRHKQKKVKHQSKLTQLMNAQRSSPSNSLRAQLGATMTEVMVSVAIIGVMFVSLYGGMSSGFA